MRFTGLFVWFVGRRLCGFPGYMCFMSYGRGNWKILSAFKVNATQSESLRYSSALEHVSATSYGNYVEGRCIDTGKSAN